MATLQVLSAAEIPVTSALKRPTGPLTLFIHFVHLKSYFEFRHRKAADLELIAIPFHPLTKISPHPCSVFWSYHQPVLWSRIVPL